MITTILCVFGVLVLLAAVLLGPICFIARDCERPDCFDESIEHPCDGCRFSRGERCTYPPFHEHNHS